MMQLLPTLFRSKPAIPEMDFSGEIAAVGPGVPSSRRLLVGSLVFGSILLGTHLGGAGALAEYVVVSAENVVRKPENVSLEESAGLGIAGCTALTLIERARLKQGDSVLVNGASGGIGTFVVQMAKNIVGESGRVVAICSGRNVELVKGIGADEVGNLSLILSH
jgi:reticulon-4-interacting protein 1, mitochondrial